MERIVLNPNHEKRDSEPVAQRPWATKRNPKASRITRITAGDISSANVQSFTNRATPSWLGLGHWVDISESARSFRPTRKESVR